MRQLVRLTSLKKFLAIAHFLNVGDRLLFHRHSRMVGARVFDIS